MTGFLIYKSNLVKVRESNSNEVSAGFGISSVLRVKISFISSLAPVVIAEYMIIRRVIIERSLCSRKEELGANNLGTRLNTHTLFKTELHRELAPYYFLFYFRFCMCL